MKLFALPLFDSNPDANGGGIGEVLSAVKDIRNDQETLLKNYDQLTKETKSAMEEFTKAKNRLDSIEDVTRSLQKLNMQLNREKRLAFGDPVARIAQDPEKRNLFVARIAKDLHILDACGPKIRAIAKDLDSGNTPGSTMVANNEIEQDIYSVLANFGAYRTVDVRMIGAKATEISVKSARAAMAFVDEAAEIGADSTKAGSKVTITPKKIAGLISASRELLEDDVIGVVQDILNDFAESAAYKLDWITFAADGGADATDGGFTGMFTGGTAVTAASGNVSLATTDYEDVVAVLANAPAGILSRMCKWWIHPTIIVKLLKIKDSNGRPIFNTAIEAPSYGSIGSILGFPVVPVPAAPSSDTTSALVAAFGDPMAMAVRMRSDIAFDRSEHFAFNTDEITFRAVLRAGAKIKAATGIQVLKLAAS